MKSRLFVTALTGLVLVACTASAMADDLFPPPWRGQPNTTYARWEFSTPLQRTAPDVVMNPYGVPEAYAMPGTGQVWVDVYNGRQGVWPLSGAMEITIPNSPIANPYKDIWLQITWAKQVTTSTPAISELISNNEVVTLIQTTPLANGWYQSVYNIRIFPNPNLEIIRIDGTVLVDEIVVDTICAVPEPTTMLALTGGLMSLVGFAVRRRK